MNYWLMKSEPDVFSIEDLRKKGVSGWDGVRNYQARNNLRAMKKGDLALFYHSSTDPSAIVGTMEIAREAYPDPSQFDRKSEYFDPGSKPEAPRWLQVDVRFIGKFSRPMSIDEAKRHPPLGEMILLHNTRLSIQPVRPAEWAFIKKYCE